MVAVGREVEINIFLKSQNNNCFTTKMLDIFLPVDADAKQPETLTGVYLVFEYIKLSLCDALIDYDAAISRE